MKVVKIPAEAKNHPMLFADCAAGTSGVFNSHQRAFDWNYSACLKKCCKN